MIIFLIDNGNLLVDNGNFLERYQKSSWDNDFLDR